MFIKKGDTVKVRTGDDRGKTGKVIRAFPKEERVVIEGIALAKRHQRPRRAGQKGQVVEVPLPIHVSNVSLVESGAKNRS